MSATSAGGIRTQPNPAVVIHHQVCIGGRAIGKDQVILDLNPFRIRSGVGVLVGVLVRIRIALVNPLAGLTVRIDDPVVKAEIGGRKVASLERFKGDTNRDIWSGDVKFQFDVIAGQSSILDQVSSTLTRGRDYLKTNYIDKGLVTQMLSGRLACSIASFSSGVTLRVVGISGWSPVLFARSTT